MIYTVKSTFYHGETLKKEDDFHSKKSGLKSVCMDNSFITVDMKLTKNDLEKLTNMSYVSANPPYPGEPRHESTNRKLQTGT